MDDVLMEKGDGVHLSLVQSYLWEIQFAGFGTQEEVTLETFLLEIVMVNE